MEITLRTLTTECLHLCFPFSLYCILQNEQRGSLKNRICSAAENDLNENRSCLDKTLMFCRNQTAGTGSWCVFLCSMTSFNSFKLLLLSSHPGDARAQLFHACAHSIHLKQKNMSDCNFSVPSAVKNKHLSVSLCSCIICPTAIVAPPPENPARCWSSLTLDST